VTALVGKNGVGKTNILQGIDLLAKMAHSTAPISLEKPLPKHIGLSICAYVHIAGADFRYSFAAPSVRDIHDHKGQFVVEERLIQQQSPTRQLEVFTRKGEEIKVSGRPSPIRVSPFAYSIGALTSLLPTDDPIRGTLEPISSFFSGVSYYSLGERPDASDIIPESAYSEWARGVKEGRALTESVGLRLLYMMKEDTDLFAEFQAIVGPQGLNLVTRIEIVNLTSTPHAPQRTPILSGSNEAFSYLAFEPADYMGGAGSLFPFSHLSDGSRRAIRAITAMLFDKRSLMLIEEPEDSIQPGLLHKMIDVLRSYSGRSQILFTTHSPEVLDFLSPEEVLLVSASRGVTTARGLSPEEISMASRFLKEDGTLSEFLEPLGE
jgi:energy-coupling factor transporter ATP-binding protein EcfA2